VNLYPFGAVTARPGCAFAEAIENIDVGGPTMIRAAAKNHAGVAAVTDPEQYDRVARELAESAGALSAATRAELALAAFRHTAAYDTAISAYLAGELEPEAAFPPELALGFRRVQTLRYGEN